MDRMNGKSAKNKWTTTSSIHIFLTSLFYHSTLHRLNKWRTERNGGWLFRRPKLTLSYSAEGKEGILDVDMRETWQSHKVVALSMLWFTHRCNGNEFFEHRYVICLSSLSANNCLQIQICLFVIQKVTKTKTKLRGLRPHANYTDRLSDRRLSAKLVPTLADRGCRVISAISPQSLILFIYLLFYLL
jgi:hypothetical protein